MRTLPDIGDLLEPLERAISELLINKTNKQTLFCPQVERNLVALPPWEALGAYKPIRNC